jgi:hypothetical protein
MNIYQEIKDFQSFIWKTCGHYYKHIMIVIYNSSIVNKFEASVTNDTRFLIYDCHMFIVQAIGVDLIKLFMCEFTRSVLKATSFNNTAKYGLAYKKLWVN